MNDQTPLSSKKYKTVGNLLKAPIKSIIFVTGYEKNDKVREYLCDWLFQNHYGKIHMSGILTWRVKQIANKPCYQYIIKNCFDGVDFMHTRRTTTSILNDCCTSF